MTDTPDLEAVRLTRRFQDFTAVDEVSFAAPPGSFFSILGPSGCGKTTLLRMIAGFLEPSSGALRIKGRDMVGVPPNRRPVAMVFQHLALFPMMDVGRNVGFGLRQRRVPSAEIERRVADALERVGLPGFERRRVDQLSGGQKQRVAIARAMVIEPALLLLDEPLGALDLKLREHMKVELKRLQETFGATFVYITHDQSEALVMSDQVAVMNRGRFEQIGPPQELYYNPRTAFVAGFVGDANRLRGKVLRREGDAVEVADPAGPPLRAAAASAGLAPGDEAELFVRPEAIRVSRQAEDVAGMDNVFACEVRDILFNGANSRINARVAGSAREFDVAAPQTGEFADLRRGERIHIGWNAAAARAFAAEPAEPGKAQAEEGAA
ncbi:ABC transporter ATP-binding protein [Oceanicella actignis]|uniref:ABC transporter ATP-binding protein n=1 Tax=Oceanicella actignis TaxID=1189325 RepID=UPI0011E7D315|nr:ABC transporter ATP-binding protein [Oceanicella actignis]TYO89207.1 spermidine/putrescine transport system ATP-binding protein [Oceanicella actignis]